MIKRAKIYSLVLNSVDHDSRVRKTAATLSQFGEVEVLGLRGGNNAAGIVSQGDYKVRRVVRYSPHEGGRVGKVVRQLAAYVGFCCDAVMRIRGGDLVVCNDIATLPLGVAVQFLHPALKVVYDSHEYQAQARWVGRVKRAVIRLIEKICLPFTSEIVVVSPSIGEAYARDYDIPKPRVVMNCPPLARALPSGKLRAQVGGADSWILLYQGGLAQGRGLELIIEAFSQLHKINARLVFMGFGPLEHHIREAAETDARIVLVPAVPPEEVLSYTADADFGLCVLPDDCLNHKYCLPNKLFEYLMAGVPVLANDLIEVRRVVEEGKAGVIASFTSLQAATGAIEQALAFEQSQFRGLLESIRSKYCWAEQAQVWEDILMQLGFEKDQGGCPI